MEANFFPFFRAYTYPQNPEAYFRDESQKKLLCGKISVPPPSLCIDVKMNAHFIIRYPIVNVNMFVPHLH